MGGKKKNQPYEIDDFYDMFYNPDRTEERKRYLNGPHQERMASKNEDHFKTYINDRVEKIPTQHKKEIKTPDFITSERDFVFEITTMNPPFMPDNRLYSEEINDVRKVQKAIDHAEEKDIEWVMSKYEIDSVPSNICVIYIDDILDGLHGSSDKIEHIIPSKVEIPDNVDGVVILPVHASINGQDSLDVYPPKAYIKNTVNKSRFKKLFPKFKIIDMII